MANAFTLFGELKADTASFERALRRSEQLLAETGKAISTTEKQADKLGQTSATNSRKFEKFNETIDKQRKTLLDAAAAYQKGDINARKFASVVNQTENKVGQLNSRLRDTKARMTDLAAGAKRTGSALSSVFGGTLLAGGVVGMGLAVKNFTSDSIRLFGTLDQLTRFTATLDKNFRSPANLKKFQDDIKQLATEVPHSAESIAKASFTMKSAFASLTEPELIEFLRQFSNAATASNTDVASYTESLAALGKQYKITMADLPKFGALITSSFGAALASDEKVAAGFNRILSAAQSSKQPLEDMVAAMSTLQSVSSDAESNTTLLLNVYAKLTDPKYVEGIKGMGVAVFDTSGKFRPLVDIVEDLSKKLAGMTDEQANEALAWAKDLQAREGIKILIREVENYKKRVQEAGGSTEDLAEKTKLMQDSTEAKWKRLTNAVDNYKMSVGAAIVDIAEDAKNLPPPKAWDAETWRAVIIKGLRQGMMSAISGTAVDLAPIAKRDATPVGENIALGVQIGILSGQSGVINAAVAMVQKAYAEAKSFLGIQSPSKLFMAIGKDTAQGFIDGIASMRTGVQAAMASLLDVSNIKGLTKKKDAAGVELLADLIRELDQLTPRTKLEAVMAELTAEKYAKLNAKVRERIILAAQQLDIEERRAKFLESIKENGFTSGEFAGEEGSGAGTAGDLSGSSGLAHLSESELDAITEAAERAREALFSLAIPPPADPWLNFWQAMQTNLEKFKNSLPSLKQVIGVNLIDSIQGIGDVFATAVSQWDGTAKGFFQSLAQGFRQMIQQIIAELVRMMVMKAVMSIIGAFAGGFNFTSGSYAGTSGSLAGTWSPGASSGLASGGMVGGRGTSTSDSIPAMLSNGEFVMSAKAVKKWGTGFMEQLNSGFPRPMAMASGGSVGATYNSSSFAPTIVVNVPAGNTNASAVRASAEQGAREAIRMLNKQQMRSK